MASINFSARGLILVSILILSTVHDISSSSLKAVSMLFRHGDRSPEISYPLDPYKDYPWPGGYGALSPRGAEQLQDSGSSKSSRYSSLLSADCEAGATCTPDLDKISVLSSAVQRCVDSAQNFLDGFLPAEWPSSLIEVIPTSKDTMLAIRGKVCLKYESALLGPSFGNAVFKDIIDFNSTEGKEFLAYVLKNTGLPPIVSSILLTIEDTLTIEKDNGLELPAWTDSVFDQYLIPISNAVLDYWGSSQYMKIRSSALFKDITNRLDDLIAGTSNQNILLYSAHDVTVGSMLHFLGIRDQTVARPAYGASLNLELHENSNIKDDYEVKLLYFTSYDDQNPIEVSIPDCQAPCPYNQFKSSIKPRVIDNYDIACLLG